VRTISQAKKDPKLDLRAMGRRIRELRGFDRNQMQFAEVLGVTQAQLSKYERGLSIPPLGVLLRLKHHYGKSIDWIVTGDGLSEADGTVKNSV
jgi:transcriptional regulator with XRE-family HTH domain